MVWLPIVEPRRITHLLAGFGLVQSLLSRPYSSPMRGWVASPHSTKSSLLYVQWCEIGSIYLLMRTPPMLFDLSIFPPFICVLVRALGLSNWSSFLLNASLVLLTAYVCKRNDSAITTCLLNTSVAQWLLLEMLLCEWLCRRNSWLSFLVSATP